ncbi:MAG: AAA family ATPase [Gammaproteobacteria bacterium]|nr:AAA family ATPase [Gammaproteobacteria bacterium]
MFHHIAYLFGLPPLAENDYEITDEHTLVQSIESAWPGNQIAENALLLALFNNEHDWDRFGTLIKPEWFRDDNHRIVFEEMRESANKGESFTPFTIAARIGARFSDPSHPAVNLVVGMDGEEAVGATHVFFKRVADEYARDKLIRTLRAETQYVRDATDEDIDDLIERVISRINTTTSDRMTDDDIVKSSAPELLAPVLDELAYIKQHGRPKQFLKTGFSKLDELSWGGLRPGHLIVLAGRPGMGKTSFALNLCENVLRSNDEKLTVLFFTLEQRTEEIMFKLLSAASEVPFGKLKTNRLSPDEEAKVSTAIENITSYFSNFIVINPDGLAINDMMHTVKQVKRARGRLDLVCVDYVGLMEPASKRQQYGRALEIAEITRGLKNVANQENVPVLALAQLNRNADARTDQRPRLSDLRDSGSIEQDADMVLMLHQEKAQGNEPAYKTVQLLVRKNRHGPLGDIHLEFTEAITVFVEIETGQKSEPLPD